MYENIRVPPPPGLALGFLAGSQESSKPNCKDIPILSCCIGGIMSLTDKLGASVPV